ncbi:MAG: hypothetical protein LBN71_01915 [Tannerella sp.]|jgi:hypothetical protein|nr:hypothetical protein [Tannerella sp.]
MRVRRKFTQSLTIVLLMIFMSYYVNISFFYHYHIINGVTIVHSHIYAGQHSETGTHTANELTLISGLSTLLVSEPVLFSIALLILCLLAVFLQEKLSVKAETSGLDYISLRAPPVFS